MSAIKDFTRWNRAGLDQFRYVDGNAATFLEYMRQSLIEQFTDESGTPTWTDLNERVAGLTESTTSDATDMLISQYETETDDYAWEIVRVLCRSAHILGEYLNAYSNETFIETADEWENIRKLVNMLDYQPSPPASATTTLCIEVKEGASGKLASGFQVKNAPKDGSSAAVFETLDAIDLDCEQNNLRPSEWDVSQEYFTNTACEKGDPLIIYLEEGVENLSAGSTGLLFDADTPYPVLISYSADGYDALKLQKATSGPIKKADVRLVSEPKSILTPMLNGDNVIGIDSDSINISEQAYITWEVDSSWYTGIVEKMCSGRISIKTLQEAPLPGKGIALFLLNESYLQNLIIDTKPAKRIVLPKESDLKGIVLDAAGKEVKPEKVDDEAGIEIYQYYADGNNPKLFYLPKESTPFAVTEGASPVGTFEFSGKKGDMDFGDWIIACSDTEKYALQISLVEEKADRYIITVAESITDTIHTVYGDFSSTIYPDDYNKNNENIIDIASESVSGSTVFLRSVPDSLKKGQLLSISDSENSVVVKVAAINKESVSIVITPSIVDLAENNLAITFLKHNTLLSGNCVKAGHGQIQNVMIAGSGDASKLNQRFILEPDDISFIPDTTMSAGMRAALEVDISGRVYQNVQDFSGSKPSDPHYLVRVTETGQLKIVFGDGKSARRLPTGRNNVKVTFRSGSGVRGNLDKNTLTEIVNSNALVEKVSNPIDCAGGNDCETVESLRENASSSILTLGKAVSVSDFEKLAVAHSSIWKASAFEKPAGYSRNRNVSVIIVPSEGKIQSSLNGEIETYLKDAALPGVTVSVDDFRSLFLGLKVVARINQDEYDADQVETDIKNALLNALSLSSGKLGGNIYRSQIYQIVESVTGVLNSTCFIEKDHLVDQLSADPEKNKSVNIIKSSDGIIKTVMPAKDQVIYIDENTPELNITVNSYLATESVV